MIEEEKETWKEEGDMNQGTGRNVAFLEKMKGSRREDCDKVKSSRKGVAEIRL